MFHRNHLPKVRNHGCGHTSRRPSVSFFFTGEASSFLNRLIKLCRDVCVFGNDRVCLKEPQFGRSHRDPGTTCVGPSNPGGLSLHSTIVSLLKYFEVLVCPHPDLSPGRSVTGPRVLVRTEKARSRTSRMENPNNTPMSLHYPRGPCRRLLQHLYFVKTQTVSTVVYGRPRMVVLKYD